MLVNKGKPTDISTRQDREIRTYDFLDSLDIEYERVDHAPAETMEQCEKIDASLNTAMCKNLFLCNRRHTAFYLLLMPGDKPFKTKELSSQINTARLSFAEAEYMVKYLDIHPGAVSVLGLLNDKECEVQILIDRDVVKPEHIGCHPCVNTSSLKIKTSDILEKFLPAVKHTPTFVDLKGE
ncbi:MAG: prolyl-tRNA synthetase associated domain-containing protein [Clostridia bacterium]|nr:prolyl-tRNA synthetase associated domain-containing protein [Clostridia bacterium]